MNRVKHIRCKVRFNLLARWDPLRRSLHLVKLDRLYWRRLPEVVNEKPARPTKLFRTTAVLADQAS